MPAESLIIAIMAAREKEEERNLNPDLIQSSASIKHYHPRDSCGNVHGPFQNLCPQQYNLPRKNPPNHRTERFSRYSQRG